MSQREDFKKALYRKKLLGNVPAKTINYLVEQILQLYDETHKEPAKAPESPAKASSFPVGPLPLLKALEARDAFFAAFPGIEHWWAKNVDMANWPHGQCNHCGAMKHPNPMPGGPDYCPSCAYKAGTPDNPRKDPS